METISWTGPDAHYYPKTKDWYWALWIIAVSIAVTAVILDDFLLAIIVLLASFSLSILSSRKPEQVEYQISSQGIKRDGVLYPLANISSYTIVDSRLLCKTKSGHHAIHVFLLDGLSQQKIEKIHHFLSLYLKEEQMHEPLSHLLMEYLGF